MSALRVLLADDHVLIRGRLRELQQAVVLAYESGLIEPGAPG